MAKHSITGVFIPQATEAPVPPHSVTTETAKPPAAEGGGEQKKAEVRRISYTDIRQ